MANKIDILIPCVAMAFIFVLELFAMSKGIDGKILTLSVGAISGLGGYGIGKFKQYKQAKKGGDSNG